MSRRIILQKATRVEGNAAIQITVDEKQVTSARFMVQDFRGFEKLAQGKQASFLPQIVSRICGLCCGAHQIASLRAVESALGAEIPKSVDALRQIILFGEWISSHALSYFFLSMPGAAETEKGIFGLLESQPELAAKAFALRKTGTEIVRLIGKRAVHPVSMGPGKFSITPTAAELGEVRRLALEAGETVQGIVREINRSPKTTPTPLPFKENINLFAHDGRSAFRAYNSSGRILDEFGQADFSDHISEMRADWSFAKFPYLARLGFPEGILLVGPLARRFMREETPDGPDLEEFEEASGLKNPRALHLESFDSCRLLEILWASRRILRLLEEIDVSRMAGEVDLDGSGLGIGVVEAPRGVLVHSYLISRGRMEKMKLLVATQFNNAYINLLLKDLAEKHLVGDRLTGEGEELIWRCIRTFDPCLSCATH